MPRYADDDGYGGGRDAEHRSGMFASLRDWVESEYARSGDPRDRYRPHDDGHGNCGGAGGECAMPSSDPEHPAVRRLSDYDAGQPVVVPYDVACGRRWAGSGWTDPVFELPWDAKTVRHVLVAADDTVTPAQSPPWNRR